MKRYGGIVFCILVAVAMASCLGCARSVTQIVTYGDQMKVEVTLRGTMEVNSNRYFLVLSSSESYRIPLPSPDIIAEAPEFIEPGMTPELGSEEAYYTNFFSSWAGYIILDPGGYYSVRGPFVIDQSTTRETVGTLGEISTKISFTFLLSNIFTTVPDNIYFDFVTVSWPSGSAKTPVDHLPSTGNSIYKVAGSVVEVNDLEDASLDPGLDITKCRIEMQ